MAEHGSTLYHVRVFTPAVHSAIDGKLLSAERVTFKPARASAIAEADYASLSGDRYRGQFVYSLEACDGPGCERTVTFDTGQTTLCRVEQQYRDQIQLRWVGSGELAGGNPLTGGDV